MKRRRLAALLIVFISLTIFEIFSNKYLIFLMMIGFFFILLKDNFSRKHGKLFLSLGLLSFTFLLFSSRFFIIFLVLLFLLFINKNPKIISLISKVFSDRKQENVDNEFIIVNFDHKKANPGKIKKNKWIDINLEGSESIYSWEDINVTKLIGNITFDLGKTLLPREENIILIRQAIGKVKILIPEETAVSIDFSVSIGRIILDSTEYSLVNENFTWHSTNYYSRDRKIKIVSNLLIGELEVIFL